MQDDVPLCLLSADNIVLVDETREGVNTKLEIWRKALESKGFRISRTKTEYMECKFSNSNNESRGEVKIENQELLFGFILGCTRAELNQISGCSNLNGKLN